MDKFNVYAILGVILLVTTIIGLFKNLIDKYRDDFGGGVNLVIAIITIAALFCSMAPIIRGLEGNIIESYLRSGSEIAAAYSQELKARLIQYNKQALIGIIAGYTMLAIHYALFRIKKPIPNGESRWDYSKVIN